MNHPQKRHLFTMKPFVVPNSYLHLFISWKAITESDVERICYGAVVHNWNPGERKALLRFDRYISWARYFWLIITWKIPVFESTAMEQSWNEQLYPFEDKGMRTIDNPHDCCVFVANHQVVFGSLPLFPVIALHLQILIRFKLLIFSLKAAPRFKVLVPLLVSI